jgi:hypothetical protein
MDVNTINGVLRAVIPAIIAYLVGKGTIPAADYGPLIAGVVATVAAVWSIWSKKPAPPAP